MSDPDQIEDEIEGNGLSEAWLLESLGQVAFRALVERYGGQELYVPQKTEQGRLAAVIGEDGVRKLSERLGGEYLSVPLARDFCARLYRQEGCDNPEIARRLRITVRGVERLFRRVAVPRPVMSKDGR